MRKILTGALLYTIMVMVVAPAYAQSNTELVRDTYDAVQGLTDALYDTISTLGDLAGEFKDILERFEAILATINKNSDMLHQNAESLSNIESAIYGQVCGDGTSNIMGICVPEITHCADGTYLAADTCMPDITRCGQGTLLHVDTCIADVSVSYCGEGTVFEGGVCVAISDGIKSDDATMSNDDAKPDTTQDRYIADGDTIHYDTLGDDTLEVYDIAFAVVPSLDEPGGRDATAYLLELCGEGPMRVIHDTNPSTTPPKALVYCNTFDVAHSVIEAGHATFDADDCSIREFIGIDRTLWYHEQCRMAQAATTTPSITTPTVTTPAIQTITPVRGTSQSQIFTFPVTISDIQKWPTETRGDPYTTLTISCLFEHLPTKLAVEINDDTGPYTIDTSAMYTDDAKRYNTMFTLVSPFRDVMFAQKFEVNTEQFHVYDREIETNKLLALGPTSNDDYVIRASLADWNGTVSFADPASPTARELAHKVFDVQFEVLTTITNNDCSIDMAGVNSDKTATSHRTLLSLNGGGDRIIGYEIKPIDVLCTEEITITEVDADSSHEFIGGDSFRTFTIRDVSDRTNTKFVIGETRAGITLTSDRFVIGYDGTAPDFVVTRTDASGLAVIGIRYTATSDDVCLWTERS